MSWKLNGDAIDVSSWRYSPGKLTLGIRIHIHDAVADAVRDLADDAGDYNVVTYSDGTQNIVLDSDAADTVTITPPSRLHGPLIRDDWTVEGYTERPVDGGSLTLDVTLNLQRLSTRGPATDWVGGERYGEFRYGELSAAQSDVNVLHETPGTTDWGFRFEYGDIAIPEGRVTGGEQRARTTTFRLQLMPDQGEVLLETLGTIETVEKIDVPDGDDYYVDTHPRDRNTVMIDPPASGSADEYLDAGDYAVTDWRVEFDPSARLWQSTLSIAQLAPQADVAQYGGVRYGEHNYGDDR